MRRSPCTSRIDRAARSSALRSAARPSEAMSFSNMTSAASVSAASSAIAAAASTARRLSTLRPARCCTATRAASSASRSNIGGGKASARVRSIPRARTWRRRSMSLSMFFGAGDCGAVLSHPSQVSLLVARWSSSASSRPSAASSRPAVSTSWPKRSARRRAPRITASSTNGDGRAARLRRSSSTRMPASWPGRMIVWAAAVRKATAACAAARSNDEWPPVRMAWPRCARRVAARCA